MSKKNKKKPVSHLRDTLLLGLLSLTPLVVTIWVLVTVINYLDNSLYSILPASIEPKTVFGVYIPGLGIVVTFVLLYIAGTLAKTFTGRFFQSASDSLLGRLPVVKNLYGLAKQMSTVFFSKDSTQAFKKVVLVPFPHKDTQTLAFVTAQHGDKDTTVFVPTAPNPTSGYVIIYKNTQIEDSHLTVEEALKVILSCGAASTET